MKCPECGGVDVFVPYTEKAWARFTSLGVFVNDGHNVQGVEMDYEKARCSRCGGPVAEFLPVEDREGGKDGPNAD